MAASIKPPKRHSYVPVWNPKQNYQLRLVLQTLRHYQPLTCRQLSLMTPFEISTLCRVLNHLNHKHGLIKVPFRANCRYTGHLVAHYTLRSWKGPRNGK
jgi:hypothetical protein